MTKPTPFFVLAIVAILLTFLSVWIIATLHNAAIDRQANAMLQSRNWEPPKITCKRPDQELWDCIRYVD